MCDGEPIPEGFEGIHVFDISNLSNPDLVATVPLPGGSHTATGVPDLANNRLILYNQTSGSTPPFISIVEVPLANPAATAKIGEAPLMEADACHDSGVILGNVNKLVCASHSHANVYDIGANENPGGSLTSPVWLYTITEPGVGTQTPGIGSGNWHSASLTWDGKVIVLGWEPGGGSGPRCTANGTVVGTSGTPPVPIIQQDVHKSYFFYDAKTGAKLGQFVLPRDQTLSRELHDPQLHDRAAPEQGREAALRARGRQLPVRHQRGRLHESGCGQGGRVRRPDAARPDAAWR